MHSFSFTKTLKKTIQNEVQALKKSMPIAGCVFACIFSGTCVDFGRVWDSKLAPSSTKMRQHNLPWPVWKLLGDGTSCMNSFWRDSDGLREDLGSTLGLQVAAKWAKNDSQPLAPARLEARRVCNQFRRGWGKIWTVFGKRFELPSWCPLYWNIVINATFSTKPTATTTTAAANAKRPGEFTASSGEFRASSGWAQGEFKNCEIGNSRSIWRRQQFKYASCMSAGRAHRYWCIVQVAVFVLQRQFLTRSSQKNQMHLDCSP